MLKENLMSISFMNKWQTLMNCSRRRQPNLADLFMELEAKSTMSLGFFLSSGISGFWANSQFLIEDRKS